MDFTLKRINENVNERYLLCDTNKNFYAINKLLYDILTEYKSGRSNTEICSKINVTLNSNQVNEEFIKNSIEKARLIIESGNLPVKKNTNYIKNKFVIIREGRSQWLYRMLSVLFNPYVFGLLFSVSIAVSFLFFYKNGYTNIHLLYSKILESISVSNIAFCYVFFLLVILVHELGHASAAYKLKIIPKEIGAGFYFIFPVLYTDVTNIWTLNSNKRILVNLGGIYFQLLINVVLVALLYANLYVSTVIILLVSNTSSILISFNPFFRYDGYWIFSDFFHVLNLRAKSTGFLTNFFLFPATIKNYIKTEKISPPTIFYAFANAGFWAWVYISIARYIVTNTPKILSLFYNREALQVKSVVSAGVTIFLFLWLFSLITKTFIKLFKYYNHAKFNRLSFRQR